MKNKDAKKEKIIKIAEKLFEKHGYKHVSIDRIVEKVGIAKGSFYLHFPSKDSLYEKILLRYQKEGHGCMQFLSSTNYSIQDRLYWKLVGKLQFMSQKPILREMLLGNEAYFSESITQERFFAVNREMMKKLIETAEGDLPKDITLEKLLEVDALFSLLLHSSKNISQEYFWNMVTNIGKILIKGMFTHSDWIAPDIYQLHSH